MIKLYKGINMPRKKKEVKEDTKQKSFDLLQNLNSSNNIENNKDKNKDIELKRNKTIGPYDIIKLIFTDSNQFNNLSNTILEKNFFLINRLFSIKYPLQGSMFNNMSISTANVIKSWAMFMWKNEGYGRVPYFVYSKSSKKVPIDNKTNTNIDTELIKEYCKRYHINLKDFNTLISMYKDELITDVVRYGKLISIKEQEKNISK